MQHRRRRWNERNNEKRLPPELIQKISSFVSDPQDFFIYLEAFYHTNCLGKYAFLMELARENDIYDLWPDLHIYTMTWDTLETIRPLASIFSIISFHQIVNLSLLKVCMTPTCQFHLSYTDESLEMVNVSIHEWYRELAQLPICGLNWEKKNDINCLHIDSLVAILPALKHLECLELDLPSIPSMEPLLCYVATSSLKQLSLRNFGGNGAPNLTLTDVRMLTQWIHVQPVRSFRLEGCTAAPVPIDAMMQFYSIIWNKTSLRALGLQLSTMPGFALYQFATPIQLQSLELHGCELGPAEIKSLAKGLLHSKVTTLDLTCNPIGIAGIKTLASVLPETSIKILKLVLTQAGDPGCRAIAAVLPATQIVELHLGMNLISNIGAVELANQLRSADSITILRLQKNRVTAAGAAALIQMMGSRQVETDLLDLRKNSIDLEDESMLEGMIEHLPQIKQCALKKKVKY